MRASVVVARSLVCVAIAMLSLTACARGQASPETSIPLTAVTHRAGLSCPGESSMMASDHLVETEGFASARLALADWETERTWRLHDDWHRLRLAEVRNFGETAAAFYVDETGITRLTVRLSVHELGWLVDGFEACAP